MTTTNVIPHSSQHGLDAFDEVGKGKVVHDVRSYGAVCDGTTDDATAIQAAIDAAEAAGGGIVHIPSGKTCAIDSTLTVDGNSVCIESGSTRLGIIRAGSSFSDGDALIRFSDTPTVRFGNCIRNIRLLGPSALTIGTALEVVEQNNFEAYNISISTFPNGVKIDGGTQLSFTNLNIRDCEPTTGIGVLVQDTLGSGPTSLYLERIFVDNTSTIAAGIRLLETSDTIIHACSIIDCTVGLHLIPPSGVTVGATQVIGGFYDNCGEYGIRLDGTNGTIHRFFAGNGVWFSSNGKDGFNTIGPNIQGVLLNGFIAIFNDDNGILINDGDDVKIVNGFISGNGVVSGHGINIGGDIDGITVKDNRVGLCCGIVSETQLRGILINDGAVNVRVFDNDVQDNSTSGLLDNATASTIFLRDNQGFNPVGSSSITVTASPFTYTAGHSPETVYVRAGTVSLIVVDGRTLFVATPATVSLPPNVAVTVTYSSAPTMEKYVH